MSRNDLWKWLVLAILAVLSAYVVVPPKEKIRLGLDLSGGTSFTVAIDETKLRNNIKSVDVELNDVEVQNQVNNILKDADARAIEVIRNRIDGLGVNEPVIQGGKNHRIIVQLPGASADQRDAAEKSIQSAAFLEFKLVHKQNDQLVDKVLSSGRLPEGYVSSEDGRGYKRAANYNELVKDPDYARRLSLFEVPDPRYAFMLEREQAVNGQVTYRPVFVLRKAEMNGSALSSSSVEVDSMTGRVHVSLTFNAKGSAEFARLTKAYAPRGSRNKDSDVGRQLAIVLDDTLYSAPVLKTEIPNGRAIIEGNFSWSEAAVLRNILNAGSLPAPMKILEKRSVESTLGADAIRSGVNAAILGTVLVAFFMLIYYSYCGLIANVALILDLLLLPAGLIVASSILGIFVKDAAIAKRSFDLPVLTMPGIAGIVLTLGMAVDANVLIFERMREEFALGKSARVAVAAGYDRAFLAIFDSNITTLLTAVILFIFGAGPIRGYAITLSAGIIVSMFTALVVTRLIFNATVPENRTKPYKMMQFMKNANYDFLRWGKLAGYTSLAIIVVTCAIFLGRAIKNPPSVMAVDFTGGASMTFNYEQKTDIGEVRKIVNEVVNDATIQYQSSVDGTGNLLLVKTGTMKVGEENVSKVIGAALAKRAPASKFTLAGEEDVGSEVGTDLKRSAQWAILFSLIGILIYVSVRFEFGFALGGVVALAHDAFITLGLYSLFGRQVSLTIVAALLTIVGYSINDTIVIFDRIREDLRKDPKMEFKELCNRAINQTLSRTILTSLSTLIATLALFIFGGGAINDFALAMLIGLVAGTYSTIFIATPIMLAWYRGHRPGIAQSK
ncbi:MAG TPA: protein translocase subunit SecD [Kiritimatiellia bacterium]|nr:protein translocase subunit SecD [Kiritimatiellia bacterium]HPS06431.1 protein translocase subunit SecD [Kiritimatiellia bacterium]